MIFVRVKRKSALPCASKQASVAVKLVLAVLDSFDVKVEIELFGQAVLLVEVVCDGWFSPEENFFAD